MIIFCLNWWHGNSNKQKHSSFILTHEKLSEAKRCDETRQRVQWRSEASTKENHEQDHDGFDLRHEKLIYPNNLFYHELENLYFSIKTFLWLSQQYFYHDLENLYLSINTFPWLSNVRIVYSTLHENVTQAFAFGNSVWMSFATHSASFWAGIVSMAM